MLILGTNQEWGLELDDRGDIHVFPVDDLLAHEDDDKCACLPEIKIRPDFKYVIGHNAWDGRE